MATFKALEEVVKRLEPHSVEASLAQSKSALPTGTGGKQLLAVAYCAFRDRVEEIMSNPDFDVSRLESLYLSMHSTMKLLLERGASPRVMIPARSAFLFADPGRALCSRPIEVCLAAMPRGEFVLELLQEYGSKLDGVCDGKCQEESGCCAMIVALENAMTWSKQGDHASVQNFISPLMLPLLIKVNAHHCCLCCMFQNHVL